VLLFPEGYKPEPQKRIYQSTTWMGNMNTQQEIKLLEAFRKNPLKVRAMLLDLVEASAKRYSDETDLVIQQMANIATSSPP